MMANCMSELILDSAGGVTPNCDQVFGIQSENVFPMNDWVGGPTDLYLNDWAGRTTDLYLNDWAGGLTDLIICVRGQSPT